MVQKLRGFQSWHVWARIIFSLYSCPKTNHGGYLCTDHVNVSTYLVATKGITYLPAYIVTNYIPLAILLYMMLTYWCCSILTSENLWFRFDDFESASRLGSSHFKTLGSWFHSPKTKKSNAKAVWEHKHLFLVILTIFPCHEETRYLLKIKFKTHIDKIFHFSFWPHKIWPRLI